MVLHGQVDRSVCADTCDAGIDQRNQAGVAGEQVHAGGPQDVDHRYADHKRQEAVAAYGKGSRKHECEQKEWPDADRSR